MQGWKEGGHELRYFDKMTTNTHQKRNLAVYQVDAGLLYKRGHEAPFPWSSD